MKGKTNASSPVLEANPMSNRPPKQSLSTLLSEQQNEASRIQGSTAMHSQFIASTSDLELISSPCHHTKLNS